MIQMVAGMPTGANSFILLAGDLMSTKTAGLEDLTEPQTAELDAGGDGLEIVARLKEGREKIVHELKKVIVGQDHVIEEVLIALFAGGHCLITGVPGLAKTLLIKTIADILKLKFKRIQFTPDLMPADVVGIKSGVNWIRLNFSLRISAMVLIRRVLAKPGTPVMRQCPPAKSAMRTSSMTSSWPTITFFNS